jgi:tetratricopeptide (TPR) repeat protein
MIKDTTRRDLFTAVLAILFMAAAMVPAAFGQRGEMPLSASKEAQKLFKQGLEKADNLESPGTLFDQAVQKDPSFAFGYLFAGQTNVEFQRNFDKAVALADKASPAEREWILSVASQNTGDEAAALTHLQNLEKLAPRDKRVLMQIGNYYRNLGDNANALKYFKSASNVDKKYAPPYNIIGYTYLARGDFTNAEKAFKTYISLIPNNPNPYDSYAEMLLNSGKFDASIKQYSTALSKDPTFYNSYEGMGNAYEYQGDYSKARETYQMMFDKSNTEALKAQALASMTNSFVSEGRIEKAFEVIDRRIAIAQAADDLQTVLGLHNLAALIATESGDFEAAAKHLEMAETLMKDPSLPPANAANRTFNASVGRARLLIAKGDTAGAKTEIDWMSGAAKNIGQLRAYNFLAGVAASKSGNYSMASEFFAKANQADPFVWYYQATALEAAGDSAGARRLFRKVASLNQLDTAGYAIVRPRAIAKLKL